MARKGKRSQKRQEALRKKAEAKRAARKQRRVENRLGAEVQLGAATGNSESVYMPPAQPCDSTPSIVTFPVVEVTCDDCGTVWLGIAGMRLCIDCQDEDDG